MEDELKTTSLWQIRNYLDTGKVGVAAADKPKKLEVGLEQCLHVGSL